MTSSESKASDLVLAGKCRCGAVRYEVSDAFRYAANCHCSGCRAATGSAFKAFAGIEREKLTITDGLDDIAVFGEEDLNDTRCGACGCLGVSPELPGGRRCPSDDYTSALSSSRAMRHRCMQRS